jgi:hypothetical protein
MGQNTVVPTANAIKPLSSANILTDFVSEISEYTHGVTTIHPLLCVHLLEQAAILSGNTNYGLDKRAPFTKLKAHVSTSQNYIY